MLRQKTPQYTFSHAKYACHTCFTDHCTQLYKIMYFYCKCKTIILRTASVVHVGNILRIGVWPMMSCISNVLPMQL